MADLRVTISGVDYSTSVKIGTLSITRLASTKNSLSCSILTTDNLYVGQEIIVIIDGKVRFGGLIQEAPRELLGGNILEYKLQATGYEQVLSRRTISIMDQGGRAGDYIKRYVNKYLAAEGFTIGAIDPGARVSSVVYSAVSLKDVFDELAEASGMSWWVDDEKKVYFLREAYTTKAVLEIDSNKNNTKRLDDLRRVSVPQSLEGYRNKEFVLGKTPEGETLLGIAEDLPEISRMERLYGSGVYGHVTENDRIETQEDADEAAKGILRGYTATSKSLAFTTANNSFDVNQIVTAKLPVLGIPTPEEFLINTINIHENGKEILYSIDAELYIAARPKEHWTDAFASLRGRNGSGGYGGGFGGVTRVLYDYNKGPLSIEQQEQVVALISALVTEKADLQGHLMLTYTASERATVYVRIYDNDMTELYTPIAYEVEQGLGEIGVPHCYINVPEGIHNFTVGVQVSNGKLDIGTRGVLYSIDSSYIAARLINAGMDVRDLSIKQLKTDTTPSEIWAVGIDEGKAIVKKRAYDEEDTAATFEEVYTIDGAKTAAIEFDGDWVRRTGNLHYTIETKHLPYVAVVTTDDKLVVYMEGAGEDKTPTELATGVSSVSMIRGYKAQEYKDQDQGVIVAYIKAGKAYYRQYRAIGDTYTWDAEVELSADTGVTGLQVHRLNDYRVGFLVSTATENKWLISERTYVEQAVKPEYAITTVENRQCVTVVPEGYEGYRKAADQNDLSSAQTAQDKFILTWPDAQGLSFYKDEDVADWIASISVTDTAGLTYQVKDLIIEDNKATIITEPAVELMRSVTIQWPGFVLKQILSVNGSEAITDTSYTWRLGGEVKVKENANASVTNVIRITERGIETIKHSQEETANATVTNVISIVENAVVNKPHSQEEQANTTVTNIISVTEQQVGEQPI